jgi:hypothetical protein
MRKPLTNDIDIINENINEIEKIFKESMNFCEDDDIDMEGEDMGYDEGMEEEPMEEEPTAPNGKSIDSYIDNIRKYSLNGLSALCDNPECEEYQMLKKIFQMCDKKPEKKDGMNESYRIFGVNKDNNKILFEAFINNKKGMGVLKNQLVTESLHRGIKPSDIRLVSENKIIK